MAPNALHAEDGEFTFRKPARKFAAAWIRARYPRARVLVVDDVAENDACGYAHLVKVRAWTADERDDELRVLAVYLTSIAHEPNVRRLEKRGWRSRTELGAST